MSANLDYRNDGTAAVLLARNSAWHKNGTVIEDGHPALVDLDLAMQIAGVDFTVDKVPHFVRVGDRYLSSPDSFAIIRMDREQVIGSVGATYQPLQNTDAFGVIRPALDQGIAEIETMGSLREGAQTWMMVRFDRDAIVRAAGESHDTTDIGKLDRTLNGDDPVLPFALFTNDHSGRMMARVQETLIRVVCANTYDAAGSTDEGMKVEIRHVGDVQQNYITASRLLVGSLVQRFIQAARVEDLLRGVELNDRAFNRLVLDRAVPVAHLEAKIQRREGTAFTQTSLEKASGKRDRIRDLWTDGKGHTGDRNAWEAFQGFVEWADHDDDTGVRDRMASLHDGLLQRTKRQIQGGLIAFATADEDARAAILSN